MCFARWLAKHRQIFTSESEERRLAFDASRGIFLPACINAFSEGSETRFTRGTIPVRNAPAQIGARAAPNTSAAQSVSYVTGAPSAPTSQAAPLSHGSHPGAPPQPDTQTHAGSTPQRTHTLAQTTGRARAPGTQAARTGGAAQVSVAASVLTGARGQPQAFGTGATQSFPNAVGLSQGAQTGQMFAHGVSGLPHGLQQGLPQQAPAGQARGNAHFPQGVPAPEAALQRGAGMGPQGGLQSVGAAQAAQAAAAAAAAASVSDAAQAGARGQTWGR